MIQFGVRSCSLLLVAMIGCADNPGDDGTTVALTALPKAMQTRLSRADHNHDGVLDAKEIVGYHATQTLRRFRKLDPNGSGRVELATLPAADRARLASADTDGDGVITLRELVAFRDARWLDSLRAADRNGDEALTRDEVGPVRWVRLRSADSNKDGKVTFDELRRAFAKP